MKRRTQGWLLVAALLVLGWTCTFQLRENEAAIVTRFGDPRPPITAAGLHFKWPAPIDSLARIDLRLHVLDPEPAEYLTRDKKNVIVDAFLVWRPADALRYLTSVSGVEGAEARLTDLLRSAVGDVLSANDFASLVSHEEQESTLGTVNDAVTAQAAQRALEDFGIEVAAVRVKRLSFPLQNKAAVFSRMAAERTAIATRYRAEGQERYDNIISDADRMQAEILAEARRRASEIRGSADAEAARIYAEAHAKNPELYAFLRALEVLETAVDGDATLVLPADHELLQVLREPPAMRKATGE